MYVGRYNFVFTNRSSLVNKRHSKIKRKVKRELDRLEQSNLGKFNFGKLFFDLPDLARQDYTTRPRPRAPADLIYI